MMNFPKISIIGAGNVGSTAAMMIAFLNLADVVLFDVAQNIAKAKAIDISHALSAQGINAKVSAGNDFTDMAGSEIVVVTAGFPRKPGMSRDDLLKANVDVVKSVAQKIKENAPTAIVIMVTNPLDVMTYLMYKVTGFSQKKVFGMAGVLDSARLINFISIKLNVKRSDIEATVLGSHGDLMVPVFSQTRVSGKPITEMLSQPELQELSELTKNSGAEIVSLLGTGSAYYGPAASIAQMVKAILQDNKTTHCVCGYLQGEYGLRDVYVGIPCVLSAKGIDKIIELKLSAEELTLLQSAAEFIKTMVRKLE